MLEHNLVIARVHFSRAKRAQLDVLRQATLTHTKLAVRAHPHHIKRSMVIDRCLGDIWNF